MTVVTVTVNQWHIKKNAERTKGNELPVICVNVYEWSRFWYEEGVLRREWGPKVGPTRHYYYEYRPLYGMVSAVIHDPVNKTPCGASCWMEYRHG